MTLPGNRLLQGIGWAQVRQVFDSLPVRVALLNREHRVLYVNPEWTTCDLRRPGLDGPALYGWMAEYRPHLCARTAFITADTLSASSHRFLARAGRPILEKPLVPAELRELLAKLLPGIDLATAPLARQTTS